MLFAQAEFLQLAGGRTGQGIDELDYGGAFEMCQALAAKGNHLGLGERVPFAQDDQGLRGLAPFFMRHPDDGTFEDFVVPEESVFDLGRADILAT